MHDIFGTEVIEIFDMEYIPTGLKAPGQTAKENTADKGDNAGNKT